MKHDGTVASGSTIAGGGAILISPSRVQETGSGTGEITGLRALEDLAHVASGVAEVLGDVHPVGHERSRLWSHSPRIERRQPVLEGQVQDRVSANMDDISAQREEGIRAQTSHSGEDLL